MSRSCLVGLPFESISISTGTSVNVSVKRVPLTMQAKRIDRPSFPTRSTTPGMTVFSCVEAIDLISSLCNFSAFFV